VVNVPIWFLRGSSFHPYRSKEEGHQPVERDQTLNLELHNGNHPLPNFGCRTHQKRDSFQMDAKCLTLTFAVVPHVLQGVSRLLLIAVFPSDFALSRRASVLHYEKERGEDGGKRSR
jgi:hypothetical protein